MQCKPGVAFIPKLMTKSDRRPLNRSGAGLAGNFHIGFTRFPAVAPQINQSTQSISKEKTMKRNLIRLGFGLMALFISAAPALAAEPGTGTEGSGSGRGIGLLGAIIGMGIAAGLAG